MIVIFIERKNLSDCYEYLINEMGERFRTMALLHPARKNSDEKVTGFYKIQQDFSAFMRAPPHMSDDFK